MTPRSLARLIGIAAALVPGTLLAAPSPAPLQDQAGRSLVLPAGTEVPLVMTSELSSLTAHQGQRFGLAVAENVMASGYVAIPRGTPAVGEIRKVQGKGMLGKRGKLLIQLLFVELGGQRIRIDGQAVDRGTTGAAPVIGTAILAGTLGAFVTGTSAKLPAGTRLSGYLYRDLNLIVPE